jgi:hypothetical protein
MSDQHAPEVFVDKTPDLPYEFEDFGMSSAELQAKYFDSNEHDYYTTPMWVEAHKDQATAMPYWDWVVQQIAKDDAATPGNEDLDKELTIGDTAAATDPKQELVSIGSIDEFAGFLVNWHGRQRAQAEHLFQVPAGIEIGHNDTPTKVVLEGDKLRAFQGGVSAALSLFATLPFAFMAVDLAAPAGDQTAETAVDGEGSDVG